MGVNKVVLGGNTLMDITSTTATVSDVSTGKYFYDIDGNRVEGTGTIASEYPIGGSLADGTCTGYHISSDVTTINQSAFREQTELQSINLENITVINDQAFYNCSSLSDIDLSNVSSVGSQAFQSCSSLGIIDLSNALSIGSSSFYNCTGLSSINISNSNSIGLTAFYGCNNLTNIQVKNGVTVTPAYSSISRIATINNHMYWTKGTSSTNIYCDDTTTEICTLTSSTPSFTDEYGVTFTKVTSFETEENSYEFTITW